MSEFIVCVPARFRNALRLTSVDRKCVSCGEGVLLAADNAKAAEHMSAICIDCVAKADPDFLNHSGGMVNGKKYADLLTSLRVAQAAENRN